MRQIFVIVTLLMGLAAYGSAAADTLEMADGSLVEGRYVTSNESYFIFEVGGALEAFPVNEVAVLYLSDGVEKLLSATAEPASTTLTVPAGTPMLIAISDTIDSSRHRTGHRFRGQLQGDLVVGGTTVVRRNSYVFGKITEASQSRRLAGRSELQAEFTGIMVDGQIVPITTTGLTSEGDSTAVQSAGRTARGAAVGALIGGRSGARTGARIGAGAAILTRGESINIPRGTLVETTLAEPLAVTRGD